MKINFKFVSVHMLPIHVLFRQWNPSQEAPVSSTAPIKTWRTGGFFASLYSIYETDILTTCKYIRTYMTHSYADKTMKPQSGSSSVLQSPNKVMKVRRVFGTLIFNLLDWNFKHLYIRTFITLAYNFQLMNPQPSVLHSPNPIRII